MNKSITELFPGIQIYDSSPVEVANPYTGETVTLTPEEVAVYDLIKGSEMTGKYDLLQKGLDWFIENNGHAYMILLD
jgi:hypothetical protein